MKDTRYLLPLLCRPLNFRLLFLSNSTFEEFQCIVITSFSSRLQVNASLDEQAFAYAWGLKARAFPQSILGTLEPSDKKLMKKITLLGAANLAPKEREEVCFCFTFSFQEISGSKTDLKSLFLAVQHNSEHHGQYLFNSQSASTAKHKLEPGTW